MYVYILVAPIKIFKELHYQTKAAIPYITLPFFATALWLKHGVVPKELAYAHAASGVILGIFALITPCIKELPTAVVLINAASAIYLGTLTGNNIAICAAVLVILAHVTAEYKLFYTYFLAVYACISTLAII